MKTIKMFMPIIAVGALQFLCIWYRDYYYKKRKNNPLSFFLTSSKIDFILILLRGLFSQDGINIGWGDEGCWSSSSYNVGELAPLNPLQGNAEAPPIEEVQEPPAPVFVPDIPVLEQPLLTDEFRRVSLYDRLYHHHLLNELPLRTVVDLVDQQVEVEKRIEAALVHDGIHPQRVLDELNRLRGVLFYPRGGPLSTATLARYIREISQSGTRQSIPYRRVYRAIQNFELFR